MHPPTPSDALDGSPPGASVEVTPESGSVSRRHFAQVLAAATVLPLASGSFAAAQVPPDDLGHKPDDLSPADWDEVKARFQNLVRVYATRLDPQQRRTLLRVLTTNQHMLASIRQFSVDNGDPSATTLRLVARGTVV